MDKFKTIKSYALYTVLAVCGFAIWYLGTAFVLLDLNFANWGESTRLLVLLEGTFTSVLIVGITKISRS
tara:strand:- start:149 stop:355 length:207 start_codon:yes stop_codon:yes gene_type:complete